MSLRSWFVALWTNHWDKKLGRVGDTHAAEMDAIREAVTIAQKRVEAMTRHQEDKRGLP